MATEILQKVGTVIVLADSTDYSPAALNNLGTRTDQIDLTSLANSAYRQSDKFDFGATRAAAYRVMAAFEFAVAPTLNALVHLYLGESVSATAATGNPGNLTGADSAYTGYSSNADSAILQLRKIGTFICTVQATGTIQTAMCGIAYPGSRWGNLVVRNESGQAMHSDAVEMSVAMIPIVDEFQNA